MKVRSTRLARRAQTQVIVKEVQTGALPLPVAVKQKITAAVGQAIDPAKLGLQFDLSNMTVVDGKYMPKGTTRP